jgi:hypothetical protein
VLRLVFDTAALLFQTDSQTTTNQKPESSISMKLDQETYQEIADLITSADSPVGIDAKTTHILIIQKLLQIEKRLEAIEAKLPKE